MCDASVIRPDGWFSRDSDAGWHIHGDGLRISDGTSSSLAPGQNRLEQ